MKNRITFLSLIVMVTFLVSCNPKPPVEANIDVILISQYESPNPGKISGNLREIYTPLTETFCDSIFLLTGKVTRVDATPQIEAKIKLDDDWMSKIQKQITRQTPEMIKEQMSRCLDGVNVKEIFSRPTIRENQLSGIQSYLAKSNYHNIFAFSSDGGITDTIWNNYKLFTKLGELRDSVNRVISSQPSVKTLIIYNPPIINTGTNSLTLSTSDNTTSTTVTTTTTISQSQITAVSLEDYFNKLSDRTIPYDRKAGLRSGIVSFFTSPNAEVIKVNNNEETSDETVVGDYVEALCNTHKKVTIVKQELSGKKISKIYISES